MGSKTIPRSPAFPPVLTSDKRREIERLLFDRRRLPRRAIVQQERATGTALLVAAVPLLALLGLAMANNIRTVTVGTVQNLEDHDATRSRRGYLASETLTERSTSTPVRHLPPTGGVLHARRGLHLPSSPAAIIAQRVGEILPSSHP